jgi:oligopeptidase B
MTSVRLLIAASLGLLLCGCPQAATPDPAPKGPDVPTSIDPPDAPELPRAVKHGDTERVDPYGGMRNRDDPRVIAYLEAENDYAERVMASTAELQDELYADMLGRIKEDDTSAPYRDGGFLYFSRTFEGRDYPVYYRRKDEPGSPEEVLLDPNLLAADSDYLSVGVLQPSPDHRLLAYSLDTRGNERYRLIVRNLATGQEVAETIPDTYYSLEWAADSKSFFYTRVDDLNRPHEVWHHVLGTSPDTDRLVYREPDERFYASLSKTLSERWILVQLESNVTTEVRLIDAQKPDEAPRVFAARSQGVEYVVADAGDRFVVMANDTARTFRLAMTPPGDPQATEVDQWSEWLAGRDDVTLADILAFDGYLVRMERRDGLDRLMIHDRKTGDEREVEFAEAPYTLRFDVNTDFESPFVRVRYSSMTRPSVIYDVPLAGGDLVTVKETEVPGYDASKYRTERVWATSHDGTRVPISLMWNVETRGDGPAPLMLYGYGAYGASYDPHFSASRTVLADRGFVVGIAHVRGGGDLGRHWYEAGKLLDKPNTFRDFVACAEYLVAEGWTTSSELAISGRSAGGLLMGAVVNMRPDLFHTVVAGVPFVDMLNTMLDANLPLTVLEYEEWGDPGDPTFYEAMAAYSPYDNVRPADYPNILATAGLSDPRVGYWEPAKWVARIRDHHTGDSRILLKTQMGAGHGGPSGRYANLRETAYEYAFVIGTIRGDL